MEIIDFGALKNILLDDACKTKQGSDSPVCQAAFSTLLKNLTERVNGLTEEELALFIISMQNWIQRKGYTQCKMSINIGDIFYADLGMVYKPEFAYPHPVVILEKIGLFLLVVPTSTSVNTINEAYHPIDNPGGTKFNRKVYGNDMPKSDGFECTSALLLSNARTISRGRLLAKKGRISNITLLDEIKNTVFELLCPRHKIRINNLEHRVKELEGDLEKK